MSRNRQTLLSYLRCYESKNLQGIAAQLADDVVLRDWKICVKGKAAALMEKANNFAAARSLSVEVISVTESDASAAAELRIVVNHETELFVVDVLDFDADGRISAIRAYLGRGDA
jgi:steroid delta-isomerase